MGRKVISKFISTLALAIVMMAGLASNATAQFAGDMFFEDASVAIGEGEVGVMTVSIFSAADVMGASHARITFDDSLLEVVDVTLPSNGGADLIQEVKQSTGAVELIVVNGASLDNPIGTVGLADLTLRPKAPLGSVIPVTLERIEALTANATNYSSQRATSGEVVVTVAAAPSNVRALGTREPAELRVIENPDAALIARAARLVPAGGWATLTIANAAGVAEQVRVQVPGNAAQSE